MSVELRLLGDPVEHSVSPVMFAAAFTARGLDATYRAHRVSGEELPGALREAARRGGGNVTLPHKGAVAARLDTSSPAVRRTGACNCFWPDGSGGIAGDNTDVAGFLAALAELGVSASGTRALVVGAGGAARAVVYALGSAGAERIDVLNRTSERARRLAAATGGPVAVLATPPSGGRWDVVVNATRLGLGADDPHPLDLEAIETGAVVDLVYGVGGTAWSRWAGRLGIRVADGSAMLVEQAALSFERWFPGVAAPRREMRRAALGALDPRCVLEPP